jgi:hypothetical protein
MGGVGSWKDSSQVRQLKDDGEICNVKGWGVRGVISALILDTAICVGYVLEVTAKETAFHYEEGNM